MYLKVLDCTSCAECLLATPTYSYVRTAGCNCTAETYRVLTDQIRVLNAGEVQESRSHPRALYTRTLYRYGNWYGNH